METQASSKKAAFTFPKLYNFPPFFTKQPHLQTYQTQLEAWRKIVLEYCQFYRIWALSLNGTPLMDPRNGSSISEEDDYGDNDNDTDNDNDSPNNGNDNNNNEDNSEDNGLRSSVFKNDTINREVNGDFIMAIYNSMIERQEASWINEKNQRLGILIYWNSLEDWATMLMNWVLSTGQEGNVLTIYELQNGEAVQDQEFAGMATETLTRAIGVLAKEGRVRILKDDDGAIAGVKFGS